MEQARRKVPGPGLAWALGRSKQPTVLTLASYHSLADVFFLGEVSTSTSSGTCSRYYCKVCRAKEQKALSLLSAAGYRFCLALPCLVSYMDGMGCCTSSMLYSTYNLYSRSTCAKHESDGLINPSAAKYQYQRFARSHPAGPWPWYHCHTSAQNEPRRRKHAAATPNPCLSSETTAQEPRTCAIAQKLLQA